MGQKENIVEQYLVDQVEELGGLCVKLFPLVFSGLPDRLVLHSGKAWLVETKAPDGVLSKIQKAVHKKLLRVGFVVHVLWTREQVKQFIDANIK